MIIVKRHKKTRNKKKKANSAQKGGHGAVLPAGFTIWAPAALYSSAGTLG